MKATICLLLLATAAQIQAKIPLAKAIQQALANSAAMKSQRLEEQALQTSLISAGRKKGFTIDFGASYRHSTETIELLAKSFPFVDFSKMNIAPETILVSSPESTYDLKFTLLQPLYTGGMLSNAVRLEQVKQEAEMQVTLARAIEVAGRVKASYFTCELLQKKIDSLKFMLGSLDLHLKRLENYYREELIRKSDILETKGKIAEAELGVQDLQQLLESEKVQFQRLTGLPVDDVEAGSSEAELSQEAALAFLQASHPMVRAFDEKIRQVELQRKIAGGTAMPQVAAFAELHYGRPGMNFFRDRWTAYVQSGIGLSLAVFNWGKTGRDQHLLDLAREKIAVQRQDFLDESEKNIRQLFIQKRSIAAKMVLLEELVTFSDEDVRIKEKLYTENQVDHITYLMAVTALERHRSQREELQTQLEMVKASISALIGKHPEDK